jgi:hypothetical protein
MAGKLSIQHEGADFRNQRPGSNALTRSALHLDRGCRFGPLIVAILVNFYRHQC